MQDNNLLLLLAVGGLALVCVVALGFLFWVVARLARGPIFAFFGLLARNVDEVTDDDEGASRVSVSPRPNLRAMAEQQDFDAALAAQQMREGRLPSDLTPPAARQSPLGTDHHPRVDLNATASSADERLPPSLQSRRKKTRRGRADAEDEIFGGMLDLDGDGDPDL